MTRVALVAPLDWGLGHANRCIPIIRELLNAGFEVIIAAEGSQKAILSEEFPAISIIHINGYHLSYGNKKWKTPLKILLQSPKILTAINKENQWIRALHKEKHLAVIVSDNRFGLYHPDVFSIFITHQLYIRSPFGRIINRILQKINYRFINRFSLCWVPDAAGNQNLAGELSHPTYLPKTPVQYIGCLSRIKKIPSPITNKLLVIISGPEPQRTIFENKVMEQLKTIAASSIVIRGLPAQASEAYSVGQVTIYNHLGSSQLEQLINESDIIISRSGYSTIMDTLPLGKKCIFIPTPGQGEQEYLAKYLSGKNWIVTGDQENFSIAALITQSEKLETFDEKKLSPGDSLREIINQLYQGNTAV